jgi:16S rRNA U1498 N3-methylase RsmE
LCGLLKGDKQDFVIQKATELGVSAVVPVVCQRSVPQLGEERAEKRQQRWSRIALSAAQQCRRPDVPRVLLPISLAAAVQDSTPADPALLSLLLLLFDSGTQAALAGWRAALGQALTTALLAPLVFHVLSRIDARLWRDPRAHGLSYGNVRSLY